MEEKEYETFTCMYVGGKHTTSTVLVLTTTINAVATNLSDISTSTVLVLTIL